MRKPSYFSDALYLNAIETIKKLGSNESPTPVEAKILDDAQKYVELIDFIQQNGYHCAGIWGEYSFSYYASEDESKRQIAVNPDGSLQYGAEALAELRKYSRSA